MTITKPDTSALVSAAVEGNAALIGAAITLEQAAEAFDADFIVSAQAFAAARDGGVSIAVLAKALKARAGKSSVALRGVQWFTANASIEAHAWTGRLYSLSGDLGDDVTPSDAQTVITQTYNLKGGGAAIKAAFTTSEDRGEVFEAIKKAQKALSVVAPEDPEDPEDPKDPEESEPTLEDLLAAAMGPVLKAAEMAEADGVSMEAHNLVATLWKALATIDAVSDRQQAEDEAADLASINS